MSAVLAGLMLISMWLRSKAMNFSVTIGPELTDRQERQREATEKAAKILRAAGIECKVTYLMAGARFPDAASAMITIQEH